jgi:hypothetical protein
MKLSAVVWPYVGLATVLIAIWIGIPTAEGR